MMPGVQGLDACSNSSTLQCGVAAAGAAALTVIAEYYDTQVNKYLYDADLAAV